MVATATEAPENQTSDAPKARNTRKRTGNAKPATKKAEGKRKMTDDHKRNLAEGREQARIVDRYLIALEPTKKKRGRKVTPEKLQERLNDAQRGLLSATGAERLNLMQEEADLKARIEAVQAEPEDNIETLQAEFVKVARVYADRRGITRKTFQAYGVPLSVLKEAGV